MPVRQELQREPGLRWGRSWVLSHLHFELKEPRFCEVKALVMVRQLDEVGRAEHLLFLRKLPAGMCVVGFGGGG